MMQLAYSIGERGLLLRYDHKVNMISHETVPDQPNPILGKMLREQSEVYSPVVGREKDRLSVIPPLGDVVHPARDHDAG